MMKHDETRLPAAILLRERYFCMISPRILISFPACWTSGAIERSSVSSCRFLSMLVHNGHCLRVGLIYWNLRPVMVPSLHTYMYLKHTSKKHQPSVSCLPRPQLWPAKMSLFWVACRHRQWSTVNAVPSQCVVFKSSGKGFQVTFPTKHRAAHSALFTVGAQL